MINEKGNLAPSKEFAEFINPRRRDTLFCFDRLSKTKRKGHDWSM